MGGTGDILLGTAIAVGAGVGSATLLLGPRQVQRQE
jgi:hypothetical protein